MGSQVLPTPDQDPLELALSVAMTFLWIQPLFLRVTGSSVLRVDTTALPERVEKADFHGGQQACKASVLLSLALLS